LIISYIKRDAENDDVAEVVAPEVIASETKTPQALTVTELLDSGRALLLGREYEQAITYLLKLIEIDPSNGEGLYMLADAYVYSGETIKAQGILEMNYLLHPSDEDALKRLLNQVVENNDADAMSRIISEMRLTNRFSQSIVEDVTQSLIYTGNTDFIERLVTALQESGGGEPSHHVLLMELWLLSNEDYTNEDALYDAIIRMLENRQIPQPSGNEDFYIGGYDNQKRRSGFGIVLYSEDMKLNSIIYIGQWIDGLRSGNGIAYDEFGRYIKGEWGGDLPNGRMTYSFWEWDLGGVRVSDFIEGLGYGVIYTYNNDGSLQHIGALAQTDIIQTFIPNPDIFSWKNNEDEELRDRCDCTHFAWDAPVPLSVWGV
jgi:tetratricopeptide (TPR) repeat protein